MKRFGFLAAAGGGLLVLLLGSGCTREVHDAKVPSCSSVWVDPLMLVAQSVPTADRIPCITAVPGGWKVGDVSVRNGRTAFRLETDGGPAARMRVVLTESCSTEGAIVVPSDHAGAVRWERLPTHNGTQRVRSYTFSGGCVNYEFELSGSGATGGLVDQASLAVGFLTRAEIESRFYR